MTLAFMSFGFTELLLVGVVALLVFGGNLPDVMRTLGRSYARFRQSLQEFSRPVREEMREMSRLPSPADSPPVPRGEDAPPVEYPDYEDESGLPPENSEAGEAPEVGADATVGTTSPDGATVESAPPPAELEIDEPPPV